MITAGNRYTFKYPEIFVTLPDYSAHRNQEVVVVRQLTDMEWQVEMPGYRVRAEDGWEGDAWEDELVEVESRDAQNLQC